MNNPTASRAATFLAMGAALLTGSLALPGLAYAQAVQLENCGRTLSFDKPPSRVVSIGQGTHEILLSLGLGKSIVGTATWLAPLPADLAEEGNALPRLADNTPSFEAVLGTRPDLVMVQWINDIAPDSGRVGTFEQFAEFGIPVYVSPAECAKSDFDAGSGDGARSFSWSMDLLEQEITEIAEIFGAQEAGTTLIDNNRSRVEEARARVAGVNASDVSVLYWFSSPELGGEAYVAGQLGAPGWISEALGLTNVIDSNEEWPLVGWESLASLDPKVIVLGTMDRRNLPADDVAEKRRFLETDPVASRMSAVTGGRLIELDAQSMNPTLRAVDGVEVIANSLQSLGLAD